MADSKPDPSAGWLAEFSLKLYRQVSSKTDPSNIIVSPLSISVALAMTYAGASGNTKKEIGQVLFGDQIKSDDELNSFFANVMESINDCGGDYKLHLANRFYAHEPIVGDLKQEFTKILKEKYASELCKIDFGKDNGEYARGLINDWVGEKTNEKIKEIIPSGVLSAMTRLILVNAVYFKGDWKTIFENEDTKSMTFYAGPNKQIQVEMMKLEKKEFHYAENDQFQILRMQYLSGYVYNRLAMYILLPKERDGLKEMENSLNGEKLLKAVLEVQNYNMKCVMIPKFKLDEAVDLVETLRQLGVTEMFDPTADFSMINGKRDLFISDIIHKAFIEVNEKGTEAAAVTIVRAVPHCGMLVPENQETPTFVADHPFLFCIVDVFRTKSIIFLGRYYG